MARRLCRSEPCRAHAIKARGSSRVRCAGDPRSIRSVTGYHRRPGFGRRMLIRSIVATGMEAQAATMVDATNSRDVASKCLLDVPSLIGLISQRADEWLPAIRRATGRTGPGVIAPRNDAAAEESASPPRRPRETLQGQTFRG